jgi:peptide chain release factor subunit 1
MPTKEEFAEGDFLHHEVKKRIIGLFDASYTNEFGLRELVDKAQDALRDVGIMDEKREMARFFKELVKEDGCTAYGEESVRANLEAGAVDTLLLSEKLRKSRLTIECGNCHYQEVKTMQIEAGKKLKDLPFGHCPKCQSPLHLANETDIIEELTNLADMSSTRVEIISNDFEEGSMLFSAFGGIAAVLRYPTRM